jgi:CheY-like chemotaxis protein
VQAIDVALRAHPRVIFLDIGLPGMDGYQIARALRANAETKNAVLVALTGYGQPEDRRKTREAGFDHHLVKPADLTAISAILAGLPDL